MEKAVHFAELMSFVTAGLTNVSESTSRSEPEDSTLGGLLR